MIYYVDPVPPLINLLKPSIQARVYGNTIPASAPLPCVLIKNAGGSDYTRIQLLARAATDIEAMKFLILSMNILIQNAAYIRGLRVFDIQKEINPINSIDEDTGKPEAWCYLRMEHLES